ncbi:DMT family transporter [Saccharothrix algeriensis]|uniref:DMT family transporter n=1 Tax=Saccharothrix algeriensis TaxID=173560 RepID=A0A8T8HVJ7_9PSEU|nr:DMT family transporter [Saccharothrix algeriensis]MBM7814239.1 drug/metabolite transporter (DMT)-like permease [Saccharothrix algeriensis]QTR02593.1 DMT family transporter [Saccharothrix algeriensis]
MRGTTAVTAGVAVGVLANMAWGLAFLVPVLLAEFDPVVITVGRYLCYGLVSLVLVVVTRNRLRYPLPVWRSAVLFAVAGNVGYYFFVVQGVALVGAPVVAVVIGTLPVTVALYGNLRHRDHPFRRLVPSLLLIGCGLVVVNAVEVDWSGASGRGLAGQLLGVGCAVVALALWTWFGVANATFLKANPAISSAEWSTLVGVATLALSALATPFLLGRDVAGPGARLWWLVLGSLVLGLVVSWGGTLLWNRASTLLPVSVAGQLIVFETLSGLAYVYLATSRVPPWLEVVGIALVVAGVLIALRSARRADPAVPASPDGAA